LQEQERVGTLSQVNTVQNINNRYEPQIEALEEKIKSGNTMDVGSALSEKAQAKLSKLGFTPEMIKEMTDEDIELAKGMASKEDAKGLVDKYDPAKQQSSEVEVKKADETKDVETKRIAKINEEVSEFAVNGITDGFNHLVGNKSDAFGDIRGIASKNRGRNFFHTDTKKGKKIFGYIATKMPNGKHIVEYAAAMRPGFIAVSVSVPENSSATLEDFKEILEAKAQALLTQSVATQKNLGNETGRVAKFAISNFDKSKPVLKPTQQASEAKSLEDKVAEIKENQQFIQLSEDGSKYVNSKTGKEYERVTRFIEGEKEEDKGDTTLLDTSAALGTKIDNLVRDFFDDNLQAIESYEIGETEMIEPFLEKLQGVKDAMDARGEKVLANDIVLYNDEIGVAGTVDLLTYDAEGKFRIYDMKTMRGDNFDNSYPGEKVSKYDSDKYGKSKREKHTEQLSMYRILLHNTHGILADTIGVMPIELMYESGDSTTDRLNLLKGVSLTPYDVVKEAKLEVAQEEIQIEPLEDKRKALKQEMSSLSGELVVELDLDSPNVFGKVSDLEGMVESKQAEAEAEIAKEFGDKALSRAEAINDNFQDIIGMIAKSKINIFFDPSTKESKRCP
jgi:hypothetical protein